MSDPHTLHSPDLKQLALEIFNSALEECSIERAFDRRVQFIAGSQSPAIVSDGNTSIELGPMRHVRIVAAGKAAAPMLASLLRRLSLPSSCDLLGVLIAPSSPLDLPKSIQFFAGGHPLPDNTSFEAATAVLALLQNIPAPYVQETLCIFLISGGASSMMELPLDPSITVADTAAFYQALVHSGATIVEMNCIRKHFSAVKGGRLALAVANAIKLTLLVSDVPQAHLDALGSGPTLPDPTTTAQCHTILEKYNLPPAFPPSVRRFFQAPNLPETPKLGQFVSPAFNLIDSDDLAEIAQSHAVSLGFHAVIDNICDDWSYDAAADYLLSRIRQLRLNHRRVCLISTGEVTVKLPPQMAQLGSNSAAPNLPATTSLGGRNQHFALYIATRLRPEDVPIAVLSAGTDGVDGNSKAAGAVVDQNTLADRSPRSPRMNREANESTYEPSRAGAIKALQEFNSGSWLSEAGAVIVTGPTGHNLRDLRILLAE